MGNRKNRVLSNMMWKYAERCGAQAVGFVVSVILARLLLPSDYGTIALISVFISVLHVFVDGGMGMALVQKKDADNADFSSVFYFNIIWCIFIYLVLFGAAPYIATFYNNQDLTILIRVLGINLLVSSVKNIESAYVSKYLQLKKFFWATLGGTIGAAIVGIWMAYKGYGVWALIAQSLYNNTVDTIILWITVKWRPIKVFSITRLKGLVGYGWKYLASGLLDTIYGKLQQLIIGKCYTEESLAFYNQGEKLPQLIINNINSSIDAVIFPTMSMEQDDILKMKSITRRSMTVSIYLMAPFMIGLAVIAPALVRLLLTEKWLPCIPYLRIFCICYIFYPVHTSNLNAIRALGRSDIFLKLEIIKKIIGIVILLSVIRNGVMAMAYSQLLSSVLSQIINSWPNKKLLGYSYLEQMKDILPSVILAVFMGGCVSLVALFDMPDIIIVVLQIFFGTLFYIVGSIMLKIDAFGYLREIVRQYLVKKRTVL